MGEALGVRLLIVVIDDLHFHVIGACGDFRNAPKDLDYNLFLGHMIRRGGLKPHPLPYQTLRSNDGEKLEQTDLGSRHSAEEKREVP